MARWEHLHCGSVHEGAIAPPAACPSCAGAPHLSPSPGWRWLAPLTERERAGSLPASRRSRRRIGTEQRRRIHGRDGWRCLGCGSTDKDSLTIDHVIPVSRGGGKADENLQTMCGERNCRKGAAMNWVRPLRADDPERSEAQRGRPDRLVTAISQLA